MENQDAQPIRSSSGTLSEFQFQHTDIEAFYASLESSSEDTTSSSHLSVKSLPSEETQKKLQILKDLLVSKDFSLLLHPGRSIEMKNTLNYLLSLPPDEEFSPTIKSELLQLLQCFVQWSLEYLNAGVTATAELSNAREVMTELEANVKEFQVLDKEDKCLCNQLASLEEEKRKLEEKINSIKIQIANSTARRDRVGKRKIGLFLEGRLLKAQRDDVTIRVPRMKAEEELAERTRANIEAEWSKLREHFIRSTSLKDWVGSRN